MKPTLTLLAVLTLAACGPTAPTHQGSWGGVVNGLADCRASFDAGAERDDCEGAVIARFYPAPPCQVEDSPGPCVWDAWSRTDATGQSFIRNEDGSVLNLVTGQLTK